LGEGLLHVWPVTRSVTRLLTSDVSSVPLCLRRNAELRFVGHIATDRGTWDAVAGSKPSGRTRDLADRFLSGTLQSCRRDRRGRRHRLVSQVWDGGRKAMGSPDENAHPSQAGQGISLRRYREYDASHRRRKTHFRDRPDR
jgi:hypothetical protein